METLQDYKKTEIIDGVVYNMAPPDNKHRTIQGNLYLLIGNFLKGKRCRVFFESEVHFTDDMKVQPDLFVVCDTQKLKNKYTAGAPDFIVEILSLSTRRRDLTLKKDAYEKFGVKEYWIIDPKGESIDVYLLKNGKYVLDNTYQNVSDAELEEMDAEEKAEVKLSLKLSLYDDLEIQVRDVFEGTDIFEEVHNMVTLWYDENEAREYWREEAFENGMEKGILKSIQNLMHSMHLTPIEAMNALMIPPEQQKELEQLL